jgi:mRNA interferase MazF
LNLPAVQRGDVFEANLNPTKGSEQGGTRPVLVISRDAINRSSPVVIIVPFTDAANKTTIYPSHARFSAGTGGLTLDSLAICEQVRAISKTRLVSLKGKLNRSQIASVEAALKIALDLP